MKKYTNFSRYFAIILKQIFISTFFIRKNFLLFNACMLILLTSMGIVFIDAISRGVYEQTLTTISHSYGDFRIIFDSSVSVKKIKNIYALINDVINKYDLIIEPYGFHYGLLVNEDILLPVIFEVSSYGESYISGNKIIMYKRFVDENGLQKNKRYSVIFSGNYQKSTKTITSLNAPSVFLYTILENKDEIVPENNILINPVSFERLADKNAYNGIMVKLPYNQKNNIKIIINQLIKKNIGIIIPWYEYAKSFYIATELERHALLLILLINMIIVAFSYYAFLAVFYNKRLEDILFYKGLGIPYRYIIGIHSFLISLCALISTLIGGAIGIFFSFICNYYHLISYENDCNIKSFLFLAPSFYTVLYMIIFYIFISIIISYRCIKKTYN
jgi:hypothetical protein